MTEIRTPTELDWPALAKAMSEGFADDYHEESANSHAKVFEAERSLIGLDGDQIVSTAGIFTRDLTVPGAIVPAAHVTMVSVAPTHRRQGLLTRMMRQQFADVRAGSTEPVAVLWASEGAIYQRFGYGLASLRMGFTVDLTQVRLKQPPTPGQLRNVPMADAVPVLSGVYERVRAARPGFSSRPGRWWEYRLDDDEKRRDGASALRCTVSSDADGQPNGYAIWRSKPDWTDFGPNGAVHITEVVAADADGYRRLWNFLLTMDLVRRADMWLGGIDEPLVYLVNEPRRLQTNVGDGLWLRIIDLPAALAARRYLGPFDVVLEVTDAHIPENAGRWRLTVKGDEGHCVPTTDEADLSLDIADLGALYLGGVTLPTLVRAGRVTELRPGAADGVAAGFAWTIAPQGIEIF